jgi:hypothetical protein
MISYQLCQLPVLFVHIPEAPEGHRSTESQRAEDKCDPRHPSRLTVLLAVALVEALSVEMLSAAAPW